MLEGLPVLVGDQLASKRDFRSGPRYTVIKRPKAGAARIRIRSADGVPMWISVAELERSFVWTYRRAA